MTAVSGRGVGMDVVKTNIERIGGTIELKSGRATAPASSIKIPLTLAIVSALIVEAGGERFAIPQISVVELVRARARQRRRLHGDSMIETINGTPVLRLRDRLLPARQSQRPAPARRRRERATSESGGVYIVVTQVGASMLGIIVDRVFDTEEIVVKPVAPILRHMTMFSGNTILGDGSVIMILDPNGIARATGIVGGRRGAPEIAGRSGAEQRQPSTNASRCCCSAPAARSRWRCRSPLSRASRTSRAKRVETSSGKPVTQYRGRLMPLVPLSGTIDPERPSFAVLVFNDVDGGTGRGDRCMGLVVDEIVDVVEDMLQIQLSGVAPGVLGTAVIAERATDVIDTGYWLTQAHQDWFRSAAGAAASAARILVVEDSDFFRQMLAPTLVRSRLCRHRSRGCSARAAPARHRRHVRRDRLRYRDAGHGRPRFRACRKGERRLAACCR